MGDWEGQRKVSISGCEDQRKLLQMLSSGVMKFGFIIVTVWRDFPSGRPGRSQSMASVLIFTGDESSWKGGTPFTKGFFTLLLILLSNPWFWQFWLSHIQQQIFVDWGEFGSDKQSICNLKKNIFFVDSLSDKKERRLSLFLGVMIVFLRHVCTGPLSVNSWRTKAEKYVIVWCSLDI